MGCVGQERTEIAMLSMRGRRGAEDGRETICHTWFNPPSRRLKGILSAPLRLCIESSIPR